MSENEDISSSTSKSLLPGGVVDILNKGMSEGFKYDSLSLGYKKINDSMMPEICEWIVKLGERVKGLSLYCNQITSVGASMLFDTLNKKNSSIKEIYLYSNKQIDDKCMKLLGEYVKSNKSIESIRLGDASISDTGIEILAPYLDGNTTFKGLYLNHNKGITDKSIRLFEKMIEFSCIEYMSINDTSITQDNIIYVLSACNRIKNGSTSLDLSQKWLNDDDLIMICESMKKYGIDKLKNIYLVGNDMPIKGATMLFDTLKECNSVVSYFDFAYNKLDDECMKQLGEYIQNNEYVEILRLEANILTDNGVEILSESLIGNTTLKRLNLNGSKGITDASVPHLIELVNKSSVTKMNLHETSISEEKQQKIKEALSVPIEQREIPVKSNTKSAAKIQSSST